MGDTGDYRRLCLSCDSDDECPVLENHINIRKTALMQTLQLYRQFIVPVKGISAPEDFCIFSFVQWPAFGETHSSNRDISTGNKWSPHLPGLH